MKRLYTLKGLKYSNIITDNSNNIDYIGNIYNNKSYIKSNSSEEWFLIFEFLFY